jgi:hypothetical protein
VALAGNSKRANEIRTLSENNIKKDIVVSKDRLSPGSEITEIVEGGVHVFQVNEAEFHKCPHIQIKFGDLALVVLLDSGA